VAGRPVDLLTEDVGVPVVPGVLLDHVRVNPAQVDLVGSALVTEGGVQWPARGRGPGQVALLPERGEAGLGAVRLGQVEVAVRDVVGAVPEGEPGLARDPAPEPGPL